MQLTNSLITVIKNLKKTKFRKEKNLFVVEGKKICEELLLFTNYKIEFVVVQNNLNDEISQLIQQFQAKNITVYKTKQSIFETLCDTVTPQGILAVVVVPKPKIIANKSFVALDNISDPGNVGTIIRTAEWFGIKQILLVGECAEMHNPKVIRASMGSILRLNIIAIDNNTVANFFRSNFKKQDIFAASLDAKQSLNDIQIKNEDFQIKNKNVEFGLIMGSETQGISAFFDEIITKKFMINGFGNAESLNVAVATGISLYHLQNIYKNA